ncbi:hypothetical protein FRC09_010346 [Ceratobasidium sp. 395]|nr:hypothetical protein FRC09_010346 [Ceratobasidium sp. 395]
MSGFNTVPVPPPAQRVSDTMPVRLPYTTPDPIKPIKPVPPVPHPQPKPAPNAAHDVSEPEDPLVPPRPETPPLPPHSELKGRHEPPPLPTTPPPDSPKNNSTGLPFSLESVGTTNGLLQDANLAGGYEPPPVPTTPPPPSPSSSDTNHTVHSNMRFDLGSNDDIVGVDLTGEHEPPPVPHTPPPPSPKNNSARTIANTLGYSAIVDAIYVNLAGGHEPPPPPTTPPPPSPANRGVCGSFSGVGQNATASNSDGLTQTIVTILLEAALVSASVIGYCKDAFPVVDNALPTVSCVSVVV